MPSTRDLVRRIRSVKGTQQITKAMKMVAAAQLRKAQLQAEQSRPYAEKALRERLQPLGRGDRVTITPRTA